MLAASAMSAATCMGATWIASCRRRAFIQFCASCLLRPKVQRWMRRYCVLCWLTPRASECLVRAGGLQAACVQTTPPGWETTRLWVHRCLRWASTELRLASTESSLQHKSKAAGRASSSALTELRACTFLFHLPGTPLSVPMTLGLGHCWKA